MGGEGGRRSDEGKRRKTLQGVEASQCVGQGVEILNFKKVVKEEKMRGKNKCMILKGGVVEVEVYLPTPLQSPWTSREFLGNLTRRCGGTMLQTTWIVCGTVWGQKGLDWTNKVGKLLETD